MSQLPSLRRAGTTLGAATLATALAVGVTPAHAVSPSSPAGHGATWLSHQLNKKGLIHNRQFDFDDYGLTIDTAFGLKAIGGHKKDVARARKALSKHVDDYTTFAGDEFAGADAKLLAFAQQTGGGARSFGGTNLVSRLTDRVLTAAPSTGRIHDLTASSDSANVVGQIFAARGLLKADTPLAPAVLDFLLEQQCDNGFFRLTFAVDPDDPNQACSRGDDDPDTDVTALAVVELSPVAKGHPALKTALKDAVRWLKRHQHDNGSFGGAGPTSAVNANSTGLAGWAFLTEGVCGRARDAAHWLARLQVKGDVSGTPLAGERGAIAYDHAALKTAKSDGIDKTTRDQWRRAGAQAAPALVALSRCRS